MAATFSADTVQKTLKFSTEDLQKMQDEVYQDGKGHITRGFEQLGPERLARALKYPYRDHSWQRCFFAVAYGEPGDLSRMVQVNGESVNVQVARILGMDALAVNTIVAWYDSDFLCPLLLQLAEEWLEQNRRPVEQAATTAAVAG